MERYAAVVLSAGTGKRMKSDIPKQYMLLMGKPVIYYSLKAFQESPVSEIVLVCGKDDIAYCTKEIVEKYNLTKVCAVVAGGRERYHSVYEGLKAVSDADYVLIHDGARPMVDEEIICRIMEEVWKEQACVAAMPVKDTIKIADPDGYVAHTPDRSLLWQIQTPQAFSYPLIKAAYETVLDKEKRKQAGIDESVSITDDAMVAELVTGKKVRLIEGSYQNIKITTPEDIGISELFLQSRKEISKK